MYMPEGTIDRILNEQNLLTPLQQTPRRSTDNARGIRNEFADYFFSYTCA